MARSSGITGRIAAFTTLAGLACGAQAQMYHHLDGSVFDDQPYDIIETKDGGYATAGSISGQDPFGNFVRDFYIVKHDVNGAVQWWTRYGGQAEDVAYSIEQTTDGGYIVAGHTNSSDPNYQLALLRLDLAGGPVWAQTYRGDAFGELLNPAEPQNFPQPAVIEAFNGDFVAVSNVRTNNGLQHGILLRVDPAGNLINNQQYFETGNPDGTFLTFTDVHELTPQDLDGDGIFDRADLAVTGYTTRIVDPTAGGVPFLGGQDVFAMRTNPGGGVVWANQYSVTPEQDSNNEEGYGLDVVRLPNTDAIAIGVYWENNDALPGTQHYWLDAGTGSINNSHITLGMIPSFASTRFTEDPFGAAPVTITSGQDVGFVPTPTGTAAAVAIDAFAPAILWAHTYTDAGNFRERFEATALPISDNLCGYAFTTTTLSAAGIGGLDNYMVKTNDLGQTACLFTPVQPESFQPDPNRIPRDLETRRDQEQIQWGFLLNNGQQDFSICYDSDCVLCPADLNGDGVLNNADINLFVNFFIAMNPAADLNNDGVWNNTDINLFVALFTGGC